MKLKLLLLTTLLFVFLAKAQNLTEKESQVDNVELETQKIDKEEIIPFGVIDIPPLAPDCKEKWSSKKKKECLSKFIQNHLQRKFNTELAAEVGLSGKIRIEINFIIDTNGNTKNITATGGPEIMNQNAIDVIGVLPQLKPALIEGKAISVSYHLPLLFYVAN